MLSMPSANNRKVYLNLCCIVEITIFWTVVKAASHPPMHSDRMPCACALSEERNRGSVSIRLAPRASGLVGEHGVEEGVLRTVGRKISATSNIPS